MISRMIKACFFLKVKHGALAADHNTSFSSQYNSLHIHAYNFSNYYSWGMQFQYDLGEHAGVGEEHKQSLSASIQRPVLNNNERYSLSIHIILFFICTQQVNYFFVSSLQKITMTSAKKWGAWPQERKKLKNVTLDFREHSAIIYFS